MSLKSRTFKRGCRLFDSASGEHPHHEAARERLELPVEKMSKTVHKYGNTSAASIPISLVEELEAGKIKDGDVVVMVGFGGGLTWGAIAIRWGR